MTSSPEIATDRIQLTKNWSLRKLHEGDPMQPRWALQFMGMDWLVIAEFLPPGKDGEPTIDDELRKFADEVGTGVAQQPAPPSHVTDDDAMLRARALVDRHIAVFGYVPNPDKLKEAVAAELRDRPAQSSKEEAA